MKLRNTAYLLSLFAAIGLTCSDEQKTYMPVNGTIKSLDMRLDSIVRAYYRSEILSDADIDKVVQIECIAILPNPVVEISAIDTRIEQLESANFYVIDYGEFFVLLKPSLSNIFNYPDRENSVRNYVGEILDKQPAVPRTGYRTDTWNAILYEDSEVEVINVTDTLEKYDFEPGSLDRVYAKIFPCVE